MQENKMEVLNILNVVHALLNRCLLNNDIWFPEILCSKGTSFQLFLDWLVVFVMLAVENKDIWLEEKGIIRRYSKDTDSLHVAGVQ